MFGDIYRRIPSLSAFACLLTLCFVSPCAAQGWEWPEEMRLGGFSITNIRGTVNSDGSGEAEGIVSIPGIPGQKTRLRRSSDGDISAEVLMSARISGAELLGTYLLDAGGLRTRKAEIRLVPHSVSEVTASVDTSGRFSGTGKARLGRLLVPVKFSISRDSFVLEGAAEVRAQQDTPLAKYTLSGTLKLTTRPPQMLLSVSGSVERIGKLSNQSARLQVSNVPVDASQGTCSISMEGVVVTFDLF
ncbi:MAG: hypothetical protein QHI38_05090 [Armatimonadota bacterium]|nr:hypothetical protein [Armatimonadota bacterium]